MDLAAGKSAGLVKRRLNGFNKPRWLKLFERPRPGLSPRFPVPNAPSETGSVMEIVEMELNKSGKESNQDTENFGITENGRFKARFNGSERLSRNARAYRRWLRLNTKNAGISNVLGKRKRTTQEESTRENARSSEIREEGEAKLSRLEDLPSGSLPEAYKDYLIYVDKLRHRWNKRQNAIVVDDQLDQERVAKVVLFVLSLQHVVRRPFLIVTTSCGLSVWEAGFSRLAPSANLIVYKGSKNARSSIRSLKFYDGGCQIMFEVLLSCSDVVVEDVEVLTCIEWKAIVIDECQRSSVSKHFEHFKSLATDMRLLLVSTQIKDCPADYLTMLSLLNSRLEDSSDTEIHSATELCELKERLTAYMAYECKSGVLGFTEYWVPVWLSNVQLEQYCSILLSNYAVLGSVSKNESPDSLREIVMSIRKCCDHPYLLDQSLQSIILNDSPVQELLNVEVQVSGKLLLLDKILPEIKTRGLRALIIFQSVGRSGKDSAGDILEDFVSQRFGRDCYARIDGIGGVYARSKKLAALNTFNNRDSGKFVFLIDSRACLPSIKLCSVDTVILFDSDWDPQNDLKSLRRITINSQFEQLTVFRLYTCFTSEEMVLILAKKGITVDHTIDCMNRTTCNTLLRWGVSRLFNRLDDFHGCITSVPGSNLFSEWSRLDGVLCELLSLLPFGTEHMPSSDSYISKVEESGGAYVKNILLLGEKEIDSAETDDPLLFWKYLLEARRPQWYFLPEASSRSQRKLKFLCNFPKKSKLGNDAVSCKGFDKQVDPTCLRPRSKRRRRAIAADKEYKVTGKESSSNQVNRPSTMHPVVIDFTGSPKADKVVLESRNMLPSLQNNSLSSLKLEIRQLCKILKLPDNVKDTAVALLKYIMGEYNVSWKTISTFQAFQISVCWMAADFLKHKIDHKESLILANLQLRFECKELEANYISSKLQRIKKPFARHLGSVEKVDASDHVENSKATASEKEYLGGDVQMNTNDVQMTSCEEQDLAAEQIRMGFESQKLPHELDDLEKGEMPPRSCYSKISKLTVPDLQDFEEGEILVGFQGKTISGELVDLEKGGMLDRVQSPNLLDQMVPTILQQSTGVKIDDNLKESNHCQCQINKHENSLQASHPPSSIVGEPPKAHEMVQQEKANQILVTLSGGDCLPHTLSNIDDERQPCDSTAGQIGSKNTIPEVMPSVGLETHSAALPLPSDSSEIALNAEEPVTLSGGDCLPNTLSNINDERQPCDTTAGQIGSENTIPEVMLSVELEAHSAALPLPSDSSEIALNAEELCILPEKPMIIIIESDTEKDDAEADASKGVAETYIEQSNGVKSSTPGIKDGVPVSLPLEKEIPVSNINTNDAAARPSEVSQTQPLESFKVDELLGTRTHDMATEDEGTTSERAKASEVRQNSQETPAATPFAGESFDLEFTRADSTMLQQDISTIQGGSFGLQQLPVSTVPSSGVRELLSIPTISGMQCFQSNKRSAFSQEVHVSGQQDQMLLCNTHGTGTYLPRPTAMHAGTHDQDYRSIAAALGYHARTVTPAIPQHSSLDPLQIEIDRLRKNDEQDLKTHEEMVLRIKSERDKETEKVREKYDRLLQDAEIALMQRRLERKTNILKVSANKFLADAWTIDLKVVSSGTKKGLRNELIHPSIPLASAMEVFNRSTTLATSVSPMTSFTYNLQGGIHLWAPDPHLRASRSQPPLLPSYRPAIFNSSLNQRFSSSSTVASVVGTTPAPRQPAGSHHTCLPPDVDGLRLPICHGASVVGTTPAPKQPAVSHHTYLPPDVDGLRLPMYHGNFHNTF